MSRARSKKKTAMLRATRLMWETMPMERRDSMTFKEAIKKAYLGHLVISLQDMKKYELVQYVTEMYTGSERVRPVTIHESENWLLDTDPEDARDAIETMQFGLSVFK